MVATILKHVDMHASATVSDWDAIYAVNIRGTFLCYKYAAQYMVRQGKGGRIIGACSVSGKIGDYNFLSSTLKT